jgi:phytoene dehydrogenase-like protein
MHRASSLVSSVFERRSVVGGACVTEEFHPGFRNSTAAYTVSLLQPKVIQDLKLHNRGLHVVERRAQNFLPLPGSRPPSWAEPMLLHSSAANPSKHRDNEEGMLPCTHTAAMSVLAKMDSGFGTERRIAAFGSTAARLMKAYSMQMEVLRRMRNGGQQFVRVEAQRAGGLS